MSQSPLHRSTRRSLPAFAHTPSRLSKATSSSDLASAAAGGGGGGGSKSRRFVIPEDLEQPAADSTPVHAASGSIPRSRTDSQLATTGSTGSNGAYSTPTRLSYDGENSTPRRTPIYYSPQATSTPPAGLSKSASIPFDMAASAKAARTAAASSSRRVDHSVDGQASPAGVNRKGPRKSERFIRKKSLLQRIVDYPQHLIDTFLLLSPTSMLDVLPDERYAHPIALGIHALHFLCTAPLWLNRAEETSILRSVPERGGVGGRWGKWEDEQRGQKYGRGWGVLIFTIILLLIASANAIYLFSRFRTYDMQLRSAHEPALSPHASPVKSPTSTASPDDPFSPPAPSVKSDDTPTVKAGKIAWKVLVFLLKGSYAAISSMLGHPTDRRDQGYGHEDRIQALRVWDPPDFCVAFFCAYPPTAPLQTHLLTPLHPLLTPLLHLTSAILLSYLAQHFRQLIKDRLVLSAEVMREYDRRFVYKRIFGSRVDRGCQTEQAETVW